MADYPEKGKVSYKWLESVVVNDIDPFTGGGRTGDAGTVFGLVMYHLRHLGLLKEEKIEFDTEQLDAATLQEEKAKAIAFWQ